jgi:hypothetical protein
MFKEWGECAQQKDTTGKIISDAATLNCLPVIFANLLSALLAFAGLMAVLMFVMGSFKFINSAGDPKKIEGAKNSFVYGLIGLVIILFSFLIIRIISTVTGVECVADFTNFSFTVCH